MKFFLFVSLLTGFLHTSLAQDKVQPLRLKLPTINTGLIDGSPETFYMGVNRVTDGVASRPWSGGKFGYWRTLQKTPDGLVPTKFHEGIDIAPVKRDNAQRPLDIVHSIAEGSVVYTNADARASSYGKYVVVRHDWGYGPFFSLYAHLASINCKVGQKVKAESPLAKLGYTGVGIDLKRAHLHLELGIMVHPNFSHWHHHHYGSSGSVHGKYNGINLCGLDIAALLVSNNTNPYLTIPQFLKNTPVQYKVTIPRDSPLAICKTYPWIKKGDHETLSPSWEISFSSGAFPLAVEPSQKKVSSPIVSFAKPLNLDQKHRTRKLVSGNSQTAKLTSTGSRHIQLISGTFPNAGK